MKSDTSSKKISRRKFLTQATVLLAAIEIPRLAGANQDLRGTRHEPEKLPFIHVPYLVVNSGNGFIPHRHDLEIPLEMLRLPPYQNVTLKTTKTAFHQHAVTLTHEQLVTIRDGGVVTVKDDLPGEHTFQIYLPRQRS